MMKCIAIPLVAAAFLIGGCKVISGSGTLVTESPDVSNFNKISLNGSGTVNLTQGERESLTIEAEDNIMPYIEAKVKNSQLVLGFRRAERGTAIRPTKPITYTLTMKEIVGLEVSGSGSIEAPSVATDRLGLAISGSGSITISSLRAEELHTDITGSGRCDVEGEVPRQVVAISGSGEYRGSELESQSTAVDVSGSGSARVWVRENLSVAVSGSGEVDYYGSPRVVTSVSGSGDVRRIGDR
ncbi:hypothetical protein AMJ39_04980 [candidate division TA06 bacterium DG_24]|uniref:Putative auto-transporter adhesin head GIN domain-containing protein n=3 Tax=Bacteria division TA06 TaxID=1156500 RepID=A0A0S8JRQ0_UNCT6|nr:MAG: hypothetical protein AMJ39_04980 [candidate division TA06 bacterium DG_24]KPK69428.1 MAG: hypothetical protein AMJ82_05595 [candidate division TA06 bacterium SM23_40]KPL11387.1 MAG: hypothetical protein AMJ71_01085 [candidate division TA06 bacterium SM1_40]